MLQLKQEKEVYVYCLLSVQCHWLVVDHILSLIARRIWQLNAASPLLLTLVSPVSHPYRLEDNCHNSYGFVVCVCVCALLYIIGSSRRLLKHPVLSSCYLSILSGSIKGA